MRDIASLKKRIKRLGEFLDENSSFDSNLPFLDAIKLYGRTDRGDKLTLYNWHQEYAQLLSELDVSVIYATGSSQIGKTLMNSLLMVFLNCGGYNALWAYDSERNLNKLVPLQFRPIAEMWIEEAKIKLPRQRSKNNTLFQFGTGNALFCYTSTTKSGNSGKGAAAGSVVVAVSADILFIEERSQHLSGSTDPLYRRLDAGKIPSHPVRQLGTPGNGNGIESEIENAHHYFYPHCICEECGEEIVLNPKGCLLKPVKVKINKKDKIEFLSESGRPIEWFHKDYQNPIESAYFACPHCHAEISTKMRTKESYFKCIYKDVELRDFLKEFEEKREEKQKKKYETRIKAGINLSPLLRESSFNLAADIILSGLESNNTADWSQQRLGLPSKQGTTAITLDMLKVAMEAPSEIIDRKPDLTLAGIDQGRSEHWITIIDFYYPIPKWGEYLKKYEKQDKTIRVIRLARGCKVSEIPELLEKYGVGYGIIDNEPDITSASRLCQFTCLEMADQRSNQLEEIKKDEVVDGGIKHSCYKIHNERFLRTVLNGFSVDVSDDYPVYRLPSHWEKWLNNPSERSPLRHFQSPKFNPDSGKWERTDHIDDIYYSTMFCEVAFALKAKKGGGFWDNMD